MKKNYGKKKTTIKKLKAKTNKEATNSLKKALKPFSSSSNISLAEQVEQALTYFSSPKTLTPDYHGFHVWAGPILKPNQATLPDDNCTNTLFPAISVAYIKYFNDFEKCANSLEYNHINFRKLQLLASLLGQGERGNQFLESLTNNEPMLSNKHFVDASTSRLRKKLFECIAQSDENAAMKILGLLISRGDENHPGELDYLESYVNFKSGRYEKTIIQLDQVTEECIDYVNACRLKLESKAWLGDLTGFSEYSKDKVFKHLSDGTWFYLFLVVFQYKHII